MTSKVRSNTQPPPWNQGDGGEASFGLWLRRQREAREISLREIADSSKISLRYLEAFEQDRFDVLPAAVFTRGFLREYARFVGLDADEVVNHYLGAQQAAAPDTQADEPPPSGGSSTNWAYGLLLALAGVTVLGLVALVSFHSERSRREGTEVAQAVPEPLARPAGGAETAAPAAQPATVPATSEAGGGASDAAATSATTDRSSPAAEAATGAAPDAMEPPVPLRVTLDFTEDCWVEIAVDGRRRIQELRVPGESLTIDAQNSVVLQNVGNAGGVVVRVNGRPLDLGQDRPGKLRRPVRIDLETARALAAGG